MSQYLDALPVVNDIIFEHVEVQEEDYDEEGPAHIERYHYFITKTNDVYIFRLFEYFCSYKRRYYDPSNGKYRLIYSVDIFDDEALKNHIYNTQCRSLIDEFNKFKYN